MNYSEAFMGTGRKQTVADALVEAQEFEIKNRLGSLEESKRILDARVKQTDVEKLAQRLRQFTAAGGVVDIHPETTAEMLDIIVKQRAMLAEADAELEVASDVFHDIGFSRYVKRIHEFRTRIAPLVKQHRGTDEIQ